MNVRMVPVESVLELHFSYTVYLRPAEKEKRKNVARR